ncbi:MAG: PSD1 and planctomycete cytochrome C domain-containing protein [Limisphaerales bacterium]
MKGVRPYLALLAASFLPLAARAAATAGGTEFFENKIRPIIVKNCYTCHSSQAPKLKGGLSLEYRDTILKGGENGPAIVPGNPDESLLIKAVRYEDPDLQMPPRGKKLSDEQIADLTAWVKMGAPDTRVLAKGAAAGGGVWSKERRDHWAFKPIKKQPIPEVGDTNWVATPVDAFILARLEKEGMKPSPPADKRTLIRRVTYDLTGLPPTPGEVQAFLDDNSPGAFAKVVDRLLASPQYGERWGRYWLDTARYADTKGDIKAQQDVPLFPYAWTYRDYVVRSFNEDKPYNRFVIEQIAADKLPAGKDYSKLAALGFLALGPRFNDNKNDIYNDRIDVVCKGMLGLTVSCARCHDHKFDPIPQTDYYALRGIFDSSVEPAEDPPLETPKMTPAYQAFLQKRDALEREILQDEAVLKEKRKMAGDAQEKKDLRKDVIEARRKIARLESTDPGSPPCATVLYDSTKPHDSPVFLRGEQENKGEIVPRRFLQILSGPIPVPFRNGSGRLELALSIVNPANPLTSRVLVNRVWLHHFGEGIVTTPDDFGMQSDPPSHPELLDYLALHFMQDGWSIKKLHRLIMLSNTYQQSSQNNPRYAQIDPQNRLLWRANIHRLEFEAVRDTILALGGQLDLSLGGRPVELGSGAGGFSHRRTIYGMVDRRNLPELYSQFDFANPDITTGKRYETTVPQQALFMMNNPLVVELARKLVNENDFKDLVGEEARIKFLYERIFQREPTEVEIKLGMDFIEESPAPEQITNNTREHIKEQRRQQNKPGQKGGRTMTMASLGPNQIRPIGSWVKYAHALLQTNEAIFIN